MQRNRRNGDRIMGKMKDKFIDFLNGDMSKEEYKKYVIKQKEGSEKK